MLSLQNRLKKKKDFDRVFKKGKGFKEGFLFIKAAENGLETTRFGFVVSKTFSKKAVLRNKVKRKLREVVRNKASDLEKGFDIVLVAMKGLEKKNISEIEKIINSLFKRAKLF